MTEDEAKTKWCPHVRITASGDDWETNRGQSVHDEQVGSCIGSNCMAWRWVPLLADDAFKAAVIKAADDIGDKTDSKHRAAKHVTENRAAYGLPVAPFDGFCGLGGKP